jgi:hypothetical protein
MDTKDFIKKVFLGAFIWHIVKYFFRYPIRMIIITGALYFGGRYMLFNHPDVIRDGITAVKNEAVTVSRKIGEVANGQVNTKR